MFKPIGDKNVLNKKVPKSKKYENVGPAVDSGHNVRKFLQKHGEHTLNARFRRKEQFSRIKGKTLCRLLEEEEEEVNDDKERCVLVLDLRSPEDYEQNHIRGAHSYPAPRLSHVMNPFTPAITAFKNKENRIIVIYDDDEKIVTSAGKLFYEKGFDNIFVLTGGLHELVQHSPEWIEGDPPQPPPPTSSRNHTRRHGSRTGKRPQNK
eukprot:gb/GECH01009889.1/.p1 GENE.gb/GECH01009889.1/~~gb/GECH01009889.1/.p1  ORF type:complete len:207 (+),score=52.07 gb/GECH01009889.1/:1-621(+)